MAPSRCEDQSPVEDSAAPTRWRGMTAQPPDGVVTIAVRLTTRQWQIIDAHIDNEISVETVDGDNRRVIDTAVKIREQGWRQVAGWTPGAAGTASWPPDDQAVTVRLTGHEWDLVTESLSRWSRVEEEIGDDQQAATSRAIRDLVIAQLQ